LVDFIIINRVFSGGGIKNKRFWWWLLVSLLMLNFCWSLGMNQYDSFEVYSFDIGMNYLLIITGLFLIKPFRDKLINLIKIKEIKEEENKEEQDEKTKSNEFSNKYPKINKFPFVRNIVGWMYKEGWGFSIGLLVIVLIGAYFRWPSHFPTNPGHFSLAALGILDHGLPVLPSGMIYFRDPITLYLMALSMKIFGISLFSLKIPYFLISLFQIVLVYQVVKIICRQKKYGIFAAALIALSPWHIAYAQVVTHYYNSLMFFILWSLFLFLKSSINIFNGLTNKSKSIYNILFFISVSLAVLVERGALILNILFIPYCIEKVRIKNFVKLLLIIIFVIFTILVSSINLTVLPEDFVNLSSALPAGNLSIISRLLENINLNFKTFNYEFFKFFSKWFSLPVYIIVLGIIISIFNLRQNISKRKSICLLFLFFCIFLAFILLLGISNIPSSNQRYLSPMIPLFFILISVSVSFIILVINHFYFKNSSKILVILFLILVIPGISQLRLFTGGRSLIKLPVGPTNINQNPSIIVDYRPLTSLLNKLYKEGDIIISTEQETHSFFLGDKINYLLQTRRYEKKSWIYYAKDNSGDLYYIYTGNLIIKNAEHLLKIIEDSLKDNRRVWLITGYDLIESNDRSIISLLDKNYKDNIFYKLNNFSKLYLINKSI